MGLKFGPSPTGPNGLKFQERYGQTERQTDSQTDRETEKQRERERKRERTYVIL
jgi:hypothetical protein